MCCSRPAATTRKRRNTSATASIEGRFRSSSVTPSRARPACRRTAISSPARRRSSRARCGTSRRSSRPPRTTTSMPPSSTARSSRRPPRSPRAYRDGSLDHQRRRDERHPRARRIRCRRGSPLYPFDATAADLSDPSKAVAMAQVDEVLPASSRLVIEKKAKLDPKMTYKAIIVSLPTPPLCILLEGDAAACALVREALKTASPEGKPSLFIREAAKGDTPEFRLVARDGQFVITRPNDERPLVGQIDGLDADGARRAVGATGAHGPLDSDRPAQ